MEFKKKLAVSVDFKDTSRHSFAESLYLARRANLEVVIIHINIDPSKTEADFHKLIQKMIKDQGSAATGITISYRIIPGEKGEIIDRLARTIDQIDPVYLVVGYEIKHGLNRFLGPNIKKIIYETKYPVIALKNNETLKKLENLVFPLTMDPYSRQKTNISIKFVKDMEITLCVLPMRINNTKKDDAQQELMTENLTNKLTESKVPYNVEWKEGVDEIEMVLSKMKNDSSGIMSVVFESSPDFLDNFRATREEKLLQQSEDPLLIVKCHHSPFY